jgi:F-type H+-transporting ATPase subunit b
LKQSTQGSGFSSRIVSFLLFGALIFGVMAVASPVIAQDAAPAAQAGSGKATPDEIIEKRGAKETAAEDDSVYRHTPLVRSLANTFHMDVETTARLFEFTNFGIVALAIVIPLARLMPKVMRQRSQTLKGDLESARKMTADAGARLSAIEVKLAGLDREIASIRTQVEAEAKNDEVRIKSTIEEESGRIVAAAEQEIAVAAAQAKRGLRSFAADLAIEHAAKQLVMTAETDRALIAEFVGAAGRNGGAGEGKN